MRDLERELRRLGEAMEFPATPDVAAAVAARLSWAPSPAAEMRRRRRLVLVLAVAAAAILVGVAASPARTSILRFFGIGAVRIELVDRLPSVSPEAPLYAGDEIDPADAPFPLLDSRLLGRPDHVYTSGDVATLLYGTPTRVRLIVTEVGSAELTPEIEKKLVLASSRIRFVELSGHDEPALWIESEPHIFVLPSAPPRLARNTLVWTQDGRTIRIEGAFDETEAVKVAESFS